MGQDTELRRLRGFGDTTIAFALREGAGELIGGTPLPEVALSFEGASGAWRVRHFECVEGLSWLYECVVDLATDDLSENPDVLLGQPAHASVARGEALRRIHGVVRRVEHRGTTATHRLARVYLVPALWTLSQASDARIFQGMTALGVVQAMLQAHGLYAGMLDVQVRRALPAREYCVQYGETDLAFVLRLLEAEGITFFFTHDDEGETLVLTDGPHAWRPVRTMDDGAVPVAGVEQRTHRVETVRSLVWERELRSTGFAARDFDFTRPGLRVEPSAPRRRDGDRQLFDPAPAITFSAYDDTAYTYTREDGAEQAQLRLDAERLRGAVGSGEGNVTGMAPGAVFQLSLAGGHIPAQRYLVTRVEHVADDPTVFAVDATQTDRNHDRYHNRFHCVPAEAPYRPPRVTASPRIDGLQTATVTGPEGEEIYTDAHGRIKVRFHWDRHGASDEQASCWMRVMQGPWAGDGWGFQFVPRVGMEVVVSFLEGNPDRPVVIGALFNGSHRTPYGLPEEKSRSGLRTRSTPGGAGFNELRFEDRAGAEEVFFHAQRDLHAAVEHTHTHQVGADRTVTVGATDTLRVGGRRAVEVSLDASEDVRGNRNVTVHGESTCVVDGHGHLHVEGGTSVLAHRDLHATVGGRLQVGVLGVGGDAGGDAPACSWSVVGDAVAHATGTLTLQADEGMTLLCGRSSISLHADEVRIRAPRVLLEGTDSTEIRGAAAHLTLDGSVTAEGSEVVVRGQGAEVSLDQNATLRGGQVRLASGGGTSRSTQQSSSDDTPHRITLRVPVPSDSHGGELVVLDGRGQVARSLPQASGTREGPTLRFELEVASLPRPMTLRWRVGEAHRTLLGPVDPVDWYTRETTAARRAAREP